MAPNMHLSKDTFIHHARVQASMLFIPRAQGLRYFVGRFVRQKEY
jgi:hypothetical protein